MNAIQNRLDQSRDKKALSHNMTCTAFPLQREESSLVGRLSEDQGSSRETHNQKDPTN